MNIFVSLLFLVIGFVMLVKGADWFVDGAAGIAALFGIPQLIIGLTIVAMGTSAPETAVSLTASLQGSAGITIGNILGSNILNTLLILGVASAITSIPVAKSTVSIEIPYMVAVSLLLLALGVTGNTIVFWEGIVLWAAFLLYLLYLFVMAKRNKEIPEEAKKQPLWKLLLLLIVGLTLVVGGSNITVEAATRIAEIMGISERFIGLTIVALGTSLPELVTSTSAALKGDADIAIGNIVGSNIFNILFVVGTTALITPVTFASSFVTDGIVVALSGVLLGLLVWKNQKLTRFAGILMLVCYAAYFAYLVLN